jgi:hypothetical protein
VVKTSKTKGERIVQVVSTRPRDQLVVLTVDGYVKRLPTSGLTLVDEATTGQAVTRRDIAGIAVVRPPTELWAITTSRLLPFRAEAIPLEMDLSVKSHPLLKLNTAERVIALLAPSLLARLAKAASLETKPIPTPATIAL